MSQRHKTSRSSHSTQTDLSNSSSSLCLLDAVSNGINVSSELASYSDVLLSPGPGHVPRVSTSSSLQSATTVATSVASASNPQLNGEFYEDAATLFDKLVKAEEVGRSRAT